MKVAFGDHILDVRHCQGLTGAVAEAHGKARLAFVTGFEGSKRLFVIDGQSTVSVDLPRAALFDEEEFRRNILPIAEDEVGRITNGRRLMNDGEPSDLDQLRNRLLVWAASDTLETVAGVNAGIPVSAIFPVDDADSGAAAGEAAA